MTRQEAQRLVVQGLLKKGIEVLEKKSHDYSHEDDAFSNFKFTGQVLDFAVGQGVEGVHLAFLALIATKLARLIEIVGAEKLALNEATTDTCVDLANYAALWGGFMRTNHLPTEEIIPAQTATIPSPSDSTADYRYQVIRGGAS